MQEGVADHNCIDGFCCPKCKSRLMRGEDGRGSTFYLMCTKCDYKILTATVEIKFRRFK